MVRGPARRSLGGCKLMKTRLWIIKFMILLGEWNLNCYQGTNTMFLTKGVLFPRLVCLLRELLLKGIPCMQISLLNCYFISLYFLIVIVI